MPNSNTELWIALSITDDDIRKFTSIVKSMRENGALLELTSYLFIVKSTDMNLNLKFPKWLENHVLNS